MAVLEAKLVITADDRTGEAFKKVEAHVERISALSKEIGRLSGSMSSIAHGASLAAEFERAERAAKQFASAVAVAGEKVAKIASSFDNVAAHAARAQHQVSLLGKAAHGVKHAVKEISPLVMGGAGFGVLETTKEFVKSGAEVQSERARSSVAGISDRDIAAADLQAADLAARFPNVSRAQILENHRELRSVLQNPDEAPDMLPILIKARSSMTALDPTGQSAEGLKYAVKGAELLGKAKSKEAFTGYLDYFIRAQQVMGSTANPEQLGDFAKYTRSSGQLLSDRFLHTTANSLIQEEKGSTAGKMVADVVKEMTGSFAGYHEPAKALIHLGLANKSDFDTNKQGDIKGLKPGRHVADWQLWQSDPDRAVWEKLVPAMIAKGISDPQAQVAMTRQLFPNSLAADFVSKLILQRSAFENHSVLTAHAAGIEGGQKLLAEDPIAALGSLGTAIKSFGSDITSPIMKDAAGVLSSMAKGLGEAGNAYSKWAKDNPELSKVAAGGAVVGGLAGGGALGYGALSALSSGFGLKGAAADLTAAAEALKGSAAANKGGLPPGNSPLSPSRLPLASLLWQIYSMAPDPSEFKPVDKSKAYAVPDDMKTDRAIWDAVTGAFRKAADFVIPSAHAEERVHPSLTVPPGHNPYGSLMPVDGHMPHAGAAPLGLDPGALAAALSNIKATVEGPVTATIQGSADVNVKVKFEAGTDLVKAVATAKATATGNLKANVGTSLPEAGPAGRNGTGRQ